MSFSRKRSIMKEITHSCHLDNSLVQGCLLLMHGLLSAKLFVAGLVPLAQKLKRTSIFSGAL